MSYNHYVPAWLLRNFVAGDGKISRLDLRSKTISRDPVGQVGGDHEVYEFVVSQTQPKTVESYLQVIESDAARPIKKLLKTGKTNYLSDIDRQKIAKFISVQSFRTKAFFIGLADQTLNREALFNELLRSSKLAEQEILCRHWYLLEIEVDDEFYIGDHPVALQHAEVQGYQGQLGWDLPWTDAYLPLDPKRSLWIPPANVTSEIVSGFRKAQKLLAEVRLAAVQSVYHPFASPWHIELLQRIDRDSSPINKAFETGCPLPANHENIINANSLQILFSESQVFSRASDFEFATLVLSNTPEYGGITRTSIEFVWPDEIGGNLND